MSAAQSLVHRRGGQNAPQHITETGFFLATNPIFGGSNKLGVSVACRDPLEQWGDMGAMRCPQVRILSATSNADVV